MTYISEIWEAWYRMAMISFLKEVSIDELILCYREQF